MKEFEEKKSLEDGKLKKEEIIPTEDILTDELAEEVTGGGFHICVSGRITETKPKENTVSAD